MVARAAVGCNALLAGDPCLQSFYANDRRQEGGIRPAFPNASQSRILGHEQVHVREVVVTPEQIGPYGSCSTRAGDCRMGETDGSTHANPTAAARRTGTARNTTRSKCLMLRRA